MPNRNYLAGRRCEWAVCKFYRELGWEAVRTAGSKGLVDVIAWEPAGPLHLVQVKRCKRGGAWKDKNWKVLTNGAAPATAFTWFDIGSDSATKVNMGWSPRVYAFVFRHGKSAPEIYNHEGRTEWAA